MLKFLKSLLMAITICFSMSVMAVVGVVTFCIYMIIGMGTFCYKLSQFMNRKC